MTFDAPAALGPKLQGVEQILQHLSNQPFFPLPLPILAVLGLVSDTDDIMISAVDLQAWNVLVLGFVSRRICSKSFAGRILRLGKSQV